MTLPLKEIARICGASDATLVQSIQSLWSGYGQILRVHLSPQDHSVVVKFVSPPHKSEHKYGWTGDISHQRKLSSYENELNWYQGAGQECGADIRIAKLIGSSSSETSWTFALEDLDAAGFAIRKHQVNEAQLSNCLKWLANLHGRFLSDSSSSAERYGLWPIGTYWHLATRPDEYEAMPNGDLKSAAKHFDRKLNDARFQTIVHGDAKLANFCFSSIGEVAAVDFQYVGGGCGVKDVAYFISSCFSDSECEKRETQLLDCYFGHLADAIKDAEYANAVEEEWRSLYPFAWADFHRFLSGWSPGHWKIHSYTKRLTERALKLL